MKRNLLLISNSTNAGEKYLDWCKDMIKDFCTESGVKNVLFIPYAGVSMGYDNYETKVANVFKGLGLNLYSIHKEKDANMGWSAGSNVAGLSLKTTNDMPIIEPESFDCMKLVPFQINPHYTDFFDPKHGGETRDDRLNEFTKVNPDVYVAAIREATALRLKEGKLKLIGRDNKMKVFHGADEPKEYDLNADINFLMK